MEEGKGGRKGRKGMEEGKEGQGGREERKGREGGKEGLLSATGEPVHPTPLAPSISILHPET